MVTMDLHQGFVMAIAKHLPKAARVADRYHVARMAQGAFDKVHTEVRKQLPPGERLAMFRKRALLGQRSRALSDGERDEVAETLKPFPLLQEAYRVRESFHGIYDAPTRQKAGQALSTWLEHLPASLVAYFRVVTSAVTNNREIILNYFDHRYTNALTEAQNGISKLLQHTGRGYGFEVMRVKLLYGKRGQVIDLSEYDADDGIPRNAVRYMGKMTPMRTFELANPGSTRARRGPGFTRVSQLADQGYYDLANTAVADELAPLLWQFAATA